MAVQRTGAAEGLSRGFADTLGIVSGSSPASLRWRPFDHVEVDAMSPTTSPSTNRPYGVARVCQEWGLSRSTFYHQQGRATDPPAELAKRGPRTLYTDEVFTAHIRQVLAALPFPGEGHRNVWARLRAQSIRTSKPSVVGPPVNNGTITTEHPNQMWGTDATSTVTQQDGPITVFVGG